ncbi:MAG: tRNA (adenosine(37)-N6)-threonylcarbamoyltransferase complex dimerization subunit type 1 TsaB [Thermodesulfobacteriota bacterium]
MILAIETATPHGSVALVEGGAVAAESFLPEGRQASETVLSAVSALLETRGIAAPAGISCVAVSAGPGSFTGLRVGMAAAKGYGFGWGLPIALVPTLEALASRIPAEGRIVCPVLDARKKEVYAALFRREGGALSRLTPDLALPPAALIDRLPGEEIVLCGDGLKPFGPMFADRLGGRAMYVEGAAGLPSAGAVGILGERAFLAGGAVDPRAALPSYTRLLL